MTDQTQRGLSIQSYSDYRTFLVAHTQEMRRKRPGWSYGAWARTLGLSATSSITKVIGGTRHPGTEMVDKLVRYFSFDPRDAEYFRDLVRLHKVRKDPRLAVLLMEKMGKSFPDGSVRLLDDKTFSVISHWYCLPIREMTRMRGFLPDARWIARKLRFAVTPRDAKGALRALESLGLLKRGDGATVRAAEGRVATGTDVANEAIKRFHEQMLENAREAIRAVEVDRREITGSCIVVRSEDLPRAKEMIRAFRQKFVKAFEHEGGDAVYQLQTQFFPLTHEETQS